MNEAYLIDCMEYMKTLPDKAFDLAVVDPPYGGGAADADTHTHTHTHTAATWNRFGERFHRYIVNEQAEHGLQSTGKKS